MAIEDSSLLNEYVAESREHLRSVEADFITLEKNIVDVSPDLLNRIFRSIHTIKGASGFFGLKSIGSLTHVMENLLSQLRDGELEISLEMIDALLASIDRLSGMIDDIGNSNSVSTVDLEDILRAFLGKTMQSDETKEMVDKIQDVLVSELGSELDDITFSSLSVGDYLYLLKYNLHELEDKDSFNPVQLVNELLKMGNILCGALHVPEGNLREDELTDDICYAILYSTVMDPDLIGPASELDGEHIIQIDLHEIREGTTKDIDNKDINEVLSINSELEKIKSVDIPKELSGSIDSIDSNETIRIRVDILDKLMMLAGELVLVRNQQLMHVDRTDPVSRTITQRLDVVTTDLQESIMRTRMQPIGNVFGKFNRVVRDLSKQLNKDITLETVGNEVELDKNIIEALTDPLTHIIRNSCDHGIENGDIRTANGKPATGHIKLNAYHEGGQINVEIEDDGKGISINRVKEKLLEKELKTELQLSNMSEKELLSSIFMPGFSTVTEVSELSGRGVGMDVVKTAVERLGGIIEIDSQEGKGTKIVLRLPLTLAIIPSLIVEVGDIRFAIPQINLEEMVCLYDEDVVNKIECAGSREVFRLRNILLPMIRLDEVLHRDEVFTEEMRSDITEKHRLKQEQELKMYRQAKEAGEVYHWALNFAVLKVGATRFGLIIDKIIGSEEIVVKPMHRAVKELGIYSGATVLGDGKVALILDAIGIARHTTINIEKQEQEEGYQTIQEDDDHRQSLLLFKNSGEEQFAVPMQQIKRVEKVKMDDVERVGNKEFISIDGISTRILRLEDTLNISSSQETEEMFMLLPKKSKHHYGLLMKNLVDIGEFEVDINTDTVHEDGVLGSSIINKKLTLLLEPEEIALASEPDWQN